MINNRREHKYYLKRKEEEEREYKKKKEKIKEHYESGRLIPHELRDEACDMMEDIIYEKENTTIKRKENIVVSTSRDPSSKLREFSKHLSLVVSGEYLSRGGLSVKELLEVCKKKGSECLIILNENRGVVNNMIVCTLEHGPTFYFNLSNVKYERRKEAVKQKCKLIIENMKSEIGERVTVLLQSLFNYKENNSNRIVVFYNKNDIIKYREFTQSKSSIVKIETSFNMMLYKIVKGTIEEEGEEIYKVRRFINTSAKNYVL